ncbi:MAG: hypothetical protein OEZ02_13635 [Anaerolineae bacterium]|nr:hypothetical protein [Anaerolineae bacterium]
MTIQDISFLILAFLASAQVIFIRSTSRRPIIISSILWFLSGFLIDANTTSPIAKIIGSSIFGILLMSFNFCIWIILRWRISKIPKVPKKNPD